MKGESQEKAGRGRAWLALILSALAAWIAVAGERRGVPPYAEGERAELYQALLDLQNPWTVMCVAAHPDDEDGATLTVLRRKYGVHTVTVFSTYGEGGQNAVGPELYEELGAIRARETVEASEIQGSEPHFLGLKDFGFSKSADEAFRVWGHDEALRRLVLKIRQLRPDVIITNHDTTGGHGHHQATSRLVIEAFDAAADPRRFPEQLRRGSAEVWQVQRLFVRIGANERAAADAAAAVVSVNRNERDEVRGTTYAEQALAALQRHATQGPWPRTVPPNWANAIRYRLARAAKDAPPLPANAQTFLEGMALRKEVAERVVPLAAQALLPVYVANRYERAGIFQSLAALRRLDFSAHGSRSDRHRFALADARLNRALAAAARIKATLTPHNDVLIPGTATRITLRISNGGEADAHVRGFRLRGLGGRITPKFPLTVAPGASQSVEMDKFTPRGAAVTVPAAEHLYDGKLFGHELAAAVSVEVAGTTFPVETATRIGVAPEVEITGEAPPLSVLTPGSLQLSDFELGLRLINRRDVPFSGRLIGRVLPESRWEHSSPVALAPRQTLDSRVGMNLLRDQPTASKVFTFSVVSADRPNAVIARRQFRVIWSDARVAPDLRVGYVRSFDETLRNSLAALGVEAKELKAEDVSAGDLSKFHAVIIDNRGYQAHPELVAANQRLLDYVREGGTLIVFYHRTNEWNPDAERKRPQLAPYPLTLGNSRVTDETAPVQFAEPQHRLLNYPNKITAEDFAGWVQERGLYYPEKWDAHYSAPLSMSDRGEAPLRGGLLAADYGRGRYVYTSMVWYRQLRAGVPGAYRVLANLISYGR